MTHMDDDEGYPPEGGCIGTGSICELTVSKTRKKLTRNPIGFVHFPDPPKARVRAVKTKTRRRKR